MTITSSPGSRPSSAATTAGSKTRNASGAPSSPCFGAEAGSINTDSTLPIGLIWMSGALISRPILKGLRPDADQAEGRAGSDGGACGRDEKDVVQPGGKSGRVGIVALEDRPQSGDAGGDAGLAEGVVDPRGQAAPLDRQHAHHRRCKGRADQADAGAAHEQPWQRVLPVGTGIEPAHHQEPGGEEKQPGAQELTERAPRRQLASRS